jgi:CcmD family protein
MTDQTKETAPGDRSTAFQAVQGEPEHYNGATLLVSAYAAIWVILLMWVALSWRRQGALDARLGELERVIAEADAKQASPEPKKGPQPEGTGHHATDRA